MISHFFTAPSCRVNGTFGGRVIWIPTAAEPLMVSPPFQRQQSCRGLLSRAQVGAFTAH